MNNFLTLNNGSQIPSLGLGMWKIEKPILPELVQEAIKIGYRHFDSACDYGNETQVGKGIQSAIKSGFCDREDLWITSKLWNTYHAAEHVRPALQKSLNDLQLDYLDLYLIHFPIATKFVPFEHRYPPEWFFDPDAEFPKIEINPVPIRETWEAMEDLVSPGTGEEHWNLQLQLLFNSGSAFLCKNSPVRSSGGITPSLNSRKTS